MSRFEEELKKRAALQTPTATDAAPSRFQAEMDRRQGEEAAAGLDYSQPDDVVHGEIAKLPETARESAMKRWADTRTAAKRADQGFVGEAKDFGETLLRGTPVGSWLDEGLAKYDEKVNGQDYDKSLAMHRARHRAVDKERPWLSTGVKLAGGVGSALPLSGVMASKTAAEAVLRGVGGGAIWGGVYGAGEGENARERDQLMKEGALWGAGLGGAVPAVLNVGVPMAKRLGEATANAVGGERLGHSKFFNRLGDTPQKASGVVEEMADDLSVGNRRAFDILGEEMIKAKGDVGKARHAAQARWAKEGGLSWDQAGDDFMRITQEHSRSPLYLAEQQAASAGQKAQRAGSDDLSLIARPETTSAHKSVDYLANSGYGEAVDQVHNAVNKRAALGRDYARMKLREHMPDSLEGVDSAIKTAESKARAEYRRVHNSPEAKNRMPLLRGLLGRAETRFSNKIAGRAGEQAEAMEKALAEMRLKDGGQLQTLQQVQDARQAIRGMIEAADRAGKSHIVGVLRPFYKDVTTAMEYASRDWRNVNRRWADMSFLKKAQEIGDTLSIDKAGPKFRRQMKDYNRLAPEAQAVVRTHVGQQFLDKLQNNPELHDVAKFFNTDHVMDVIRTMYGKDAAREFAGLARDLKVSTMSKNMLHNSKTHARGMAQQMSDADETLIAAAETLVEPRKTMANWVANKLRQRGNKAMADVVTTPISDVPKSAMYLEKLRRHGKSAQKWHVDPDAPKKRDYMSRAATRLLVQDEDEEGPPIRGSMAKRYPGDGR